MYYFIDCSIKTHGRVSCGQARHTEHKCVIYANQNFANFSLPYLEKYCACLYQIIYFILCMLVESLVFSHYTYALPVWGPAIHKDSLHRLIHLHNHGVRLTCGLRKYDHMSQHRAWLGWLPVDSFVKYRSLLTLFYDYYIGEGVALNPAIQFGRTHCYETRCPPHHVNAFRFKKSFGQRQFRCRASTWWNSLPFHLFQGVAAFRAGLFTHLLQETVTWLIFDFIVIVRVV